MTAGQGIDLAAAPRSKLAPGPGDEGETRQHDGGQDQESGLGKDSYGSGGGRHRNSLSGRAGL